MQSEANDDVTDIHQPFTTSEHIQQLCEIDRSITDLLTHVSSALAALSLPNAESRDSVSVGEQQQQAFRNATDALLDCLHSVDVRMKRQIWALEEAGVIRLRDSYDAASIEPDASAAASRASLRPDGAGALGSLDVGWLNSRSSRVERDMEAELWDKARIQLEERHKVDDVTMKEEVCYVQCSELISRTPFPSRMRLRLLTFFIQ